MRYVKKPVVVEAFEVTAKKPHAAVCSCRDDRSVRDGAPRSHVHLSGGGLVEVAEGDFLVREPDGSGFYPVKAGVFEELYEKAPKGAKVTEFGALLTGAEVDAKIEEAVGDGNS